MQPFSQGATPMQRTTGVFVMASVLLCALSVKAQVELGGTVVPKEQIIVFLFAGHSNMAGRCTPDDQTIHPRCWAYGASGHRYWEPCKDRIFNNSRGAGPATAFLKDLAEAYPQYYFGVIQNANTQAGVRWHNGDANNRYWKGAGRYEEMMGYARDLQGKVTFGGVVTMLGIMEATSGSSSYWNTFADDFATTIGNIRSDLGLAADRLPVLAQDYEMEACGGFSASLNGPQAIIAQNAQIPGKVPYSAIIATDGIPCPDQCHHFNLAGMRTWAQRAFNTYTNNSWDFWANVETTPPTVPSNLRTGTVGMTSAELLWDASTDASGIDHYTVSWASGDIAVAGDQTQVTVTDLEPCTNFSFTVTATDNWNNTSAAGAPLAVTTECCADNTPPTAPSGLQATSTTQTAVTLSWNASTDDQSVAGYEVYRGTTLEGSTSGANATSFTVSGLSAATSYSFTVKAKDICGNRSSASSPLDVTTADRLVVALPFKVNVGGSATGDFLADKQWQDGGDYGYTGTSRTVTVTDPVSGTDLDAVYQAVRYTECDGMPSSTLTFGYRVSVPNGDYVVTLMFAEYWRSSVGGRTFNVNIEGQPLPECPIDIYAAAGSAAAYDITRHVTVTDGVIDIQTGMVVSDPVLSGITIETAGEIVAYTITSPQDGAVYAVGDDLTIEFTANTSIVRDANFELSPDGGENWHNIMVDGAISSSDPNWGTYVFTLPETIGGVAMADKNWSLRVRDYDMVYI
ncbi:MAG: hypothetical protein GF331_25450, partial [Chitinivibrionales bacterium]|nr:hypothetical protein [Chitinivibrionales bacterium]